MNIELIKAATQCKYSNVRFYVQLVDCFLGFWPIIWKKTFNYIFLFTCHQKKIYGLLKKCSAWEADISTKKKNIKTNNSDSILSSNYYIKNSTSYFVVINLLYVYNYVSKLYIARTLSEKIPVLGAYQLSDYMCNMHRSELVWEKKGIDFFDRGRKTSQYVWNSALVDNINTTRSMADIGRDFFTSR